MLFGDPPGPDLTGIARLAAESDLLESKRTVRYFEIEARSALNRVRSGMPFTWGLNPYRGCEFGCRYCYARYTHEFMELHESDDFENQIYAKRNVAVLLASELRRVKPGEAIAIGTATDPYQPAERRFHRTRDALEVFAQRTGLSISITTKSDLIRRDVELLRAVSERNSLTVNMTITTLDVSLARELEPRAPRPDLRLAAVRALADASIEVGVFPNPIMPLITDQEPRLNALARAARDHGATYFGGGPLFLMPSARRVFLPFVEKHYPLLLRRYQERYENTAYLKGPYRDQLKERLARVRAANGLALTPLPWKPEPEPERQGRLF
ncbi:MAG: Radical domain protein [Bryobacterales bacterium]|nr:Radical domain protein [Bryobacterales bacterium]